MFIAGYEYRNRGFFKLYKQLLQNQWKTYDELKIEQEKKLKHMIKFCYNNVPYYRNMFKNEKIDPLTIKTIEDLKKIPIINKETIKNNWDLFLPANIRNNDYSKGASGGSTGEPLNYHISKFDKYLSNAILYRGWGHGGYDLGDRMILLGGSSLNIDTTTRIASKFHQFIWNQKKISAYDMNNEEMFNYTKIINTKKPKFIRGYASSIYFFAKYIELENIKIHQPRGIFTTAEKLYPHMRDKIKNVFNCEIFDNYGLNDGGVSAYECIEHFGLHIDTERSILEIVDNKGDQIESGKGKIIATSLNNFAFPFIRYDTQDIGDLSDELCNCGRGNKILKEVIGRDKEFLITPEGKYVHGAAYFNSIFAKIEKINQIKNIQIIQENINSLKIFLSCYDNFDEKILDDIKNLSNNRGDHWNFEFIIVDEIEIPKNAKYKFIINNILNEEKVL